MTLRTALSLFIIVNEEVKEKNAVFNMVHIEKKKVDLNTSLSYEIKNSCQFYTRISNKQQIFQQKLIHSSIQQTCLRT